MTIGAVEPSLSPSMDIQVSSNFERLYFELAGRDGAAVADAFRAFRETGTLPVERRRCGRRRARSSPPTASTTRRHARDHRRDLSRAPAN